ncbi:uncharacterized protein LOC132163902 isoform X2 [Corylus avellana]|uniref:uncharacterized protein LOC132163902 isoform X2 n=1 Tax=Corylus avellana TaxID=13451 RepID=UPI00286BBA7D|nr:uncharacterized protein LOC132163902 isoform X2 [Corylus avellana]
MALCACASSSSLRILSSQSPPRPRVSSSSPPLRSLSSVDKTLSQIHSSGVIACLRANSSELALKAARAALSGGITVLEIVMSTPGVLEVLQQLVQEHPTMALGVGTVLNVEDAKSAINAGAKFFMSPAMVKILSAYDAGAKIVKIYPVSALGGSQYISALKRPFCHISMIASQGITIDSIREYISRGASAVVLSDAIFNKEAISQNNFKEIYQLARLAALQGNEAVEQKKRCTLN